MVRDLCGTNSYWRYQMDVFSFWFVLASYSVKAFAQQCKLTQRSEHGLVLLDHVFKSFTVDRLVSCYIACNSQPACQSLNFRLSDKTCQFNKETKTSCPASLKQNEGFIYADNPDRGENILRTNFFPGYFDNRRNWKT